MRKTPSARTCPTTTIATRLAPAPPPRVSPFAALSARRARADSPRARSNAPAACSAVPSSVQTSSRCAPGASGTPAASAGSWPRPTTTASASALLRSGSLRSAPSAAAPTASPATCTHLVFSTAWRRRGATKETARRSSREGGRACGSAAGPQAPQVLAQRFSRKSSFSQFTTRSRQ